MSRFRVIPPAETHLTRQQMYDIIRTPVITEKATNASEHNQVIFRVPLTATKREVKAAVEGLFDVKVTAVNTIRVMGKVKAVSRPPGPALRCQKSDRNLGRRPEDRRDHRDLSRETSNGTQDFQPDDPSRRQLVIVDRSELWKGKPVKALTEGLRGKGGRNNAGRITVRWRGGGNKRRYRLVDFKRSKVDVRRRSSASNTIRTGPPLSRSSAIRTASSPISWRRSGSSPATQSSRARRSTSSRATRCRCAACRSARSSTTSR